MDKRSIIQRAEDLFLDLQELAGELVALHELVGNIEQEIERDAPPDEKLSRIDRFVRILREDLGD